MVDFYGKSVGTYTNRPMDPMDSGTEGSSVCFVSVPFFFLFRNGF